jgi:Cu-Zn family superoxide dismutase
MQRRWPAWVGLIALIVWPAPARAQPAAPAASADLRMATGELIATATFSQTPEQVLISISFRNRTALVGTHGMHIHSVGQCDPPTFASAGPILNPDGKQHGLLNPDGPMAGDLPNLVISPAGVGVYNLVTSSVQVGPPGDPHALLGGRGTALVIFSQADDDRSPPEGNAGQRIACGVIVPFGAAAPTSSSPPGGGPDLLGAIVIAVLGGLLIAGGVLLRRGDQARPAVGLAERQHQRVLADLLVEPFHDRDEGGLVANERRRAQAFDGQRV